ncbi:hypothetical protein [Streptomyces ipomoeae]|uniref:hypothetical protein n=1 Tax=Streptomyces ipomoeae TaxID=103232 RepID=UPI00066241B5|nr:hypothetical protein [Streptomyces ipomoeae]MDX2699418.1 hypothetical protein [Streptomyces ipomoeae]MDX2845077.1 hypothetical protein [Streptomyces ipomoeae]
MHSTSTSSGHSTNPSSTVYAGQHGQREQRQPHRHRGQGEAEGAQEQEDHQQDEAHEDPAEQIGHRTRCVPYGCSDHGVTVGGGHEQRPYAQGAFRG